MQLSDGLLDDDDSNPSRHFEAGPARRRMAPMVVRALRPQPSSPMMKAKVRPGAMPASGLARWV